MPVAIAGVHRSGTSLIARALANCGLYLGDTDDLMPAAPENDQGFWENLRFVDINDEILNEFGAGWDYPIAFPPNWERDGRLSAVRQKAVRLTADFGRREPWGWKDPRTSLTLPFWASVVDELQVVVCVRNPLEVAHSLRQRNQFSYARCLTLWHTYNTAILDAIPPERRIITHYEAYFVDPRREIDRLLRFLDIPADADLMAPAIAGVSPSLRHQRSTLPDLAMAEVSQEVLVLYEDLCAAAEWPCGGMHRTATRAPAPSTPLGRIDLSRLELDEMRRRVKALQSSTPAAPVSANEVVVTHGQPDRAEPDATLREREAAHLAEVAGLKDARDAQDLHLVALQAHVSQLEQALDDIRRCTAWGLIVFLWRVRTRLVPHGGLRDRLLWRGIRVWRAVSGL